VGDGKVVTILSKGGTNTKMKYIHNLLRTVRRFTGLAALVLGLGLSPLACKINPSFYSQKPAVESPQSQDSSEKARNLWTEIKDDNGYLTGNSYDLDGDGKSDVIWGILPTKTRWIGRPYNPKIFDPKITPMHYDQERILGRYQTTIYHDSGPTVDEYTLEYLTTRNPGPGIDELVVNEVAVVYKEEFYVDKLKRLYVPPLREGQDVPLVRISFVAGSGYPIENKEFTRKDSLTFIRTMLPGGEDGSLDYLYYNCSDVFGDADAVTSASSYYNDEYQLIKLSYDLNRDGKIDDVTTCSREGFIIRKHDKDGDGNFEEMIEWKQFSPSITWRDGSQVKYTLKMSFDKNDNNKIDEEEVAEVTSNDCESEHPAPLCKAYVPFPYDAGPGKIIKE